MKIELLIFYGLSIMLIVIYLDRNTETLASVIDLLKLLISGYLGYLVKDMERK
jgi:hypothetical protein